MNDATIDKFLGMFNDLMHNIEVYGFSNLDLHRLKRLQAKLDITIRKMEQEMEKD